MLYGYLTHHGIKGQKWGIRRYQNADGSLTPEGKRHYNIYKNYKKSAEKFNTMSNQLSKERSYLKDENFMSAYKKVGDEFEGYLKNNKDSLKIGKKIDKKYGKEFIDKISSQKVNSKDSNKGKKVAKYALAAIGPIVVASAISGGALIYKLKNNSGSPSNDDIAKRIKESLED